MSIHKTLNIFVYKNCSRVYTTHLTTLEEAQKDSDDAGGKEKIWGFITFDADEGTGLEILLAMSVTKDVQYTLEKFATSMFNWGRWFEREQLHKKTENK